MGDGVPMVKICGLTRNVDARLAEGLGADFLGVVLSSGFARSVPPAAAAAVVESTTANRVAVLVDEHPPDAARLGASIGASVLQLHGSEDESAVRALRDLGEWTLWKAVRARSLDDIHRTVDRVGAAVEGLLIEGWKQGVVGGGGARLTLEPAAVRDAIPRGLTFVLAGGLTPDLVAAAVEGFDPGVVDVSSGVEASAGRKDRRLMESFIRSVRGPTLRRDQRD